MEAPAELHQLPAYASSLDSLDEHETQELFQSLIQLAKESDDGKWPASYVTLLGQVLVEPKNRWPGDACLQQVEALYRLCPQDHSLRNHLLGMIANLDSAPAAELWGELLCSDPPHTNQGIQFAFQPMIGSDSRINDEILKKLVDNATGNLNVAASVYELSNHSVRTGKVTRHPAEHRRTQIGELLGALVQKLSQIEEGNLPSGETPESVASTIANAVSLIVALIDTVAVLREEKASGKLRVAAELRHRRIQIEAAAALALMGDEWGKNRLIELAAEPSIRQRVIAYSKEIGIEKDISLEYTGPIATAESHLAMWLSMPEQMGLAPTEMNLVDQRRLYWPGYEDELDCFLFEYRYGSGDKAHVNIGISGPATHAFVSDLTSLSAQDQYAAFAGWQTLSDEIYLVPFDHALEIMAAKTNRLKKLFEERHAGSASIEPDSVQAVISFFGSLALIVSTSQLDESGTLIVDEESSQFLPEQNPAAPIDWRTALDIWKGRKLLASFNPAFSS